jgi:hypothetical protein
MKKDILRMIPALNTRAEEFSDAIQDEKYLLVEGVEADEVLQELQGLEGSFGEITQGK